ncbi:hypothetical protein BS47DRAFT_1139874 [Hydnum rufescens UP504]|uniref:Uncharacterized protein n=1 Tax=Hydnum rufescens UP504 TaxID=1448309 RepID=A0A9P6ATN5_9AGAM|nr:hypothetical protein BS47DRAFT_1139874 [Hydnum rufescens UP504]
MPRPDLAEGALSLWRPGESCVRFSHGIDYRNLSERSPFPSPSFPLAENNSYLTVNWRVDDFLPAEDVEFLVPLSSLHRMPMYGDALEIPWEVWSKDVYFHDGHYQMSGGRLIRWTSDREYFANFNMTLFDLNRSRAGRLGVTSADSCTDYTQLYSEIEMGRPPPAPLASRSFKWRARLDYQICGDEHVIFWAVCRMFVPHY